MIAELLPAMAAALLLGVATGWWMWRAAPRRAHAVHDSDSLLLGAPDGPADDLTQLKGVGPKLAESLYGLGVFHFRQIAGWSPEQARTVDRRLGRFAGSIARNRLVEQARALISPDG